jgi:hypothetical protein
VEFSVHRLSPPNSYSYVREENLDSTRKFVEIYLLFRSLTNLWSCTGEFPTRKKKNSFWFQVHNKNCAYRPHQLSFFSTPSVTNFVKHHVHQNRPPWQRICKDDTTSRRHWQHSCMGASFARATTLPKPRVHHSWR